MIKKQKGFTLMEMLAVIFIMAVIAGIMLPALRRVREGGRVTHARNEINQLIAAIQMYAEDWGNYPPDDGVNHLGAWGEEHNPDAEPGKYSSRNLLAELRRLEYLDWELPQLIEENTGNALDPWENPYRYRYNTPTVVGLGVAFNLYSAGPDRKYGTEDDITNW